MENLGYGVSGWWDDSQVERGTKIPPGVWFLEWLDIHIVR